MGLMQQVIAGMVGEAQPILPPAIAEAFSTNIYNGNATSLTITNGVDLSAYGGMVWAKARGLAVKHVIADTGRTMSQSLSPNLVAEQTNDSAITSWNTTGFSINSNGYWNTTTEPYVAWTFRKAARFFDIVTFTGDGTANRAIPHSLGVAPGMIILKRTDAVGHWWMYHRSTGATKYLVLNGTGGGITYSGVWNNIEPTATHFTVTAPDTNGSGFSFVAYLFAHDTDTDNVIQCGSYAGNGSATGPTVTLGWEPQFLLIKNATAAGDWMMYDNARDTTNPRTYTLKANTPDIEVTTGNDVDFNATGFQIKSNSYEVNTNTNTYIYMAIRKE